MVNARSADRSNGYEEAADEFVARRTASSIGTATVRDWARTLPVGATVLDLGCGTGLPISATLVEEGANVFGVDASPSMIATFRARFPNAPADCSAVEDSDFFSRSFDAVVAWGLMFLLTPDVQRHLIARVATVLKPGGKFLFTSPSEACQWPDNLTGRTSVSLGAEEYRRAAGAAGLQLEHETDDEGQNHYYFLTTPRAA